MATTLKEKLEQLTSLRQKKIERRAAALVAEEMTRRELRKALKLTQKQIAELLQIDQANVSRLEQRTDLMLSTLRQYIAAMGGKLRLVVEFPNRPPVDLAGISDLEEPEDGEDVKSDAATLT